MKVSICFSTTNSIFSKIIRWITKAKISHSYLKIWDQTFSANLCLHSDWDGIQIGLLEKFTIDNFTVEEYEIEDPRLDEAVKKNLWHLGKFYNYYQLFNLAWMIILKRWFVRKIKEPAKDPKKIVCVDYVLYVFNEAGITHLPIGHLTTADLLKWCRENYESLGWKRKTFDDTPKWLQ